MPAIELCTPAPQLPSPSPNLLPSLLQTPSGLALVEIQGTIHGPFQNPSTEDTNQASAVHRIGRLEFPLYSPQAANDDGRWMKKVYLYVGKYQRLTGEVKKLAKPLAVIRKMEPANEEMNGGTHRDGDEALEILGIVKFKVLFSGRPEPVGE
ncbi:hypothetical protein H2200_002771 [Cladophialophora chaetospira]|uniref:Chromosome transmission fidelity protein 8 n=1 Tax=Cladophialophora chaetospira TaxID=386627 RepID=A0AA39CNC2_9EURO|nr:hypothetical protein H2200_002771 [Cladophialophora chaetospira]